MFANQEAPQWLSANVIRFARYSESSLKLFTEAVIDSIITGTLKFSKIKSHIVSNEQVDEIKAILGSIRVIIENAAKQGLTETLLSSDLQLLGLPNHYQLSICRPFSDRKLELQEVISSKSLKLNDNINLDWKINAMINEDDNRFICNEISFTIESPKGIVEMKDGKQKTCHACHFMCSEPMYHQLSQELRKANSFMLMYTNNHFNVYSPSSFIISSSMTISSSSFSSSTSIQFSSIESTVS